MRRSRDWRCVLGDATRSVQTDRVIRTDGGETVEIVRARRRPADGLVCLLPPTPPPRAASPMSLRRRRRRLPVTHPFLATPRPTPLHNLTRVVIVVVVVLVAVVVVCFLCARDPPRAPPRPPHLLFKVAAATVQMMIVIITTDNTHAPIPAADTGHVVYKLRTRLFVIKGIA